MAEEQGLIMVPPFDILDVIAGQGTIGLEILEQCPDVQTILVPVSGGGLIAGHLVRDGRPEARGSGHRGRAGRGRQADPALAAGRPVTLEQTESMADGLLPLSVGTIPFGILSGIVRQAVLVDEAEIAEAVRYLYRKAGCRWSPPAPSPPRRSSPGESGCRDRPSRSSAAATWTPNSFNAWCNHERRSQDPRGRRRPGALPHAVLDPQGERLRRAHRPRRRASVRASQPPSRSTCSCSTS